MSKKLESIDGLLDRKVIKKSKQKTDKGKPPSIAPSIFDNSYICTGAEYMEDPSLRFFPSNDQWLERFISCLIEWSRNTDALEIMQFCTLKAMPYRTFMDWVHRYPKFGEAYHDVRLLIGSRRRLGALLKQYDKDVVFRDLYRYDPEWKEVDKYHADLRKNEIEQDRNITIVIPPMPSVDKVKDRE